MGAWGNGSFENDDAADWVASLDTLAPESLTQIFVRAADDPAYLEAPDASKTVAAAEVVAALNQFPAAGAPTQLLDWTNRNPKASTPELRALALRAIDRVRRDSELKDLWMEADGLNDWIAALKDLQARLGS